MTDAPVQHPEPHDTVGMQVSIGPQSEQLPSQNGEVPTGRHGCWQGSRAAATAIKAARVARDMVDFVIFVKERELASCVCVRVPCCVKLAISIYRLFDGFL